MRSGLSNRPEVVGSFCPVIGIDGRMMGPYILAMLACSGGAKETGNAAPSTAVDGVDTGVGEGGETPGRMDSVNAIVDAARAFLGALDESQRASLQFGLEHPERTDWSNLPHAVHERRGVSFGELDADTVGLGWNLIRACLSAEGDQRARSIMRMEDLLWNDGDENGFANPLSVSFRAREDAPLPDVESGAVESANQPERSTNEDEDQV